MPENDLRQTVMLHEDEVDVFGIVDAWKLADYGDGFGCYAVTVEDEVRIKESGRRHRPRLRR